MCASASECLPRPSSPNDTPSPAPLTLREIDMKTAAERESRWKRRGRRQMRAREERDEGGNVRRQRMM